MLDKFRVDSIDNFVEKLFKARFIHESDEKYLNDALQMFAENEPAMKRNNAVLNDFPGELYTIEADDKITDNSKYPLAAIKLLRFKNKLINGFSKVSSVKNWCQSYFNS